jgi:predicted dehydrogenase
MRGLKDIMNRGFLGKPILGTIEMRAIPHWMPWQKDYGWLTLRIMSIHHLDIFRYLFGDPVSIYCAASQDPRTDFKHTDGIVLYTLEYENGLICSAWDDVWTGPAREGVEGDTYIKWRVEGIKGLAQGTIGWPSYPDREASTLNFSSKEIPGYWLSPKWKEVWFPDAFEGPMAELMKAIEEGREPKNSGRENLGTMALVDAAYKSINEKRRVEIKEIEGGKKE